MGHTADYTKLMADTPFADFRTYYRKKIRPYLIDLEKRREGFRAMSSRGQERRQAIFAGIIGISLAAASYSMGLFGDFKIAFALVLLGTPFLLMKYWIGHALAQSRAQIGQEYQQFYSRFKQKVVEGLVRFFDPSLTLEFDKKISKSEISDSGFFSAIDEALIEGDDYVSGKLGNIPVSFSELKVSLINERIAADIFHGLFFSASFKTDLDGAIYVVPKAWMGIPSHKSDADDDLRAKEIVRMSEQWGKVMQWNPGPTRWGVLKSLHVPNEQIAQHFEVYATQTAVAERLLTPEVWNTLLRQTSDNEALLKEWSSQANLQKAMNLHTGLSIVGNRFYVLQPQGGELFEPNLNQTFLDEEGLTTYHGCLNKVFSLAQHLSAKMPAAIS